MGLILDTSVLIASERSGQSARQLLHRVQFLFGETETAVSAISVVELTHGIHRAKSDRDRDRRRVFVEGAIHDLIVHSVSLEIAQLAGRIEGEQAALGNIIALEDLLIGATALYIGFDVATLNTKHFRRIPALNVVTL